MVNIDYHDADTDTDSDCDSDTETDSDIDTDEKDIIGCKMSYSEPFLFVSCQTVFLSHSYTPLHCIMAPQG